MSKQTAVKWLFEQLWEEPKDKFTWYALLKQAKEMEKEQIINAFEIGSDCIYDLNLPTSAEQYYNETYGGNNGK
jgi:hypothetical protein